MLDDYEKKQPLVYNYIKKLIKADKITHAFLLETNGVNYGFDLALSLSKTFLCPNNYTNNKKCKDCYICSNIDKSNYPDLKIIEVDGKEIKKDQIIELQEEFKLKPLYGKYLIYIITHAEFLNESSSNTILKFLEEPNDNIIAILITNNIYGCLDTIISRCQLLSLKCDEEKINKNIYQKCYDGDDLDNYITEENKNVVNFFESIEKFGTESIAVSDPYQFKEKIELLLTIGLHLYINVLNIKINRKIVNLNDYEQEIKNIAIKQDTHDIIKKIDIINQFLKNSYLYVNKELFIDNFIISFVGGSK